MMDAEIDVEQVPPARDLPPERREAMRELLMAQVTPPRRTWWRRSRQAGIAGIGAAALVLAGGAAAAWVAVKSANDTFSVICYSEAKLGDDVRQYRLAVADPEDPSAKDPAPPATIADPVSECADLWRSGVLGPDTAGDRSAVGKPDAAKPVPQLVSCTNEDDVAAVFPGDNNTCERLGLPRTASSLPN